MSAVLGGISSLVGIFTGVKSLFGGGKKESAPARQPAPTPKPLPPAPKIEDAKKAGADETARRRRISLLSGGRTNVTRGQATLAEGDVGRKTLLGA